MALVGAGIAGIVFPALPGHVLIFAGLLLAAWANDFTRVGPWTLTAIGIVGAASYFVGVASAGPRWTGARRNPSAFATASSVSRRGFPSPLRAL